MMDDFVSKYIKSLRSSKARFGEDTLYFVSLLFFAFLIVDFDFLVSAIENLPFTIIAIVVSMHGIYNAFHRRPMNDVLKIFSASFIILFDILAGVWLAIDAYTNMILSDRVFLGIQPDTDLYIIVHSLMGFFLLFNAAISYTSLRKYNPDNVSDNQMGLAYTIVMTIFVFVGVLIFKLTSDTRWYQIYAFLMFLLPFVLGFAKFIFIKLFNGKTQKN